MVIAVAVIGAPIIVQGHLWGAMIACSVDEHPLPLDTEARLASFTELVATAISNAENLAELTASRARVRRGCRSGSGAGTSLDVELPLVG